MATGLMTGGSGQATAARGLSTAEAAQMLGFSERTILRLGRQGHLRRFQIGRTRPLFDRQQIEALAREAGGLS